MTKGDGSATDMDDNGKAANIFISRMKIFKKTVVIIASSDVRGPKDGNRASRKPKIIAIPDIGTKIMFDTRDTMEI